MVIGAVRTFETLGPAHVAALAVTGAAAVGLIAWARTERDRPERLRAVGWVLAGVLIANELVYYAHGLATVSLADFARDKLPLHVCDVAVYLIAYVLWRGHGRVFEVAYFWGLGGTLQALLTPNIVQAFPSYEFFRFFLNHGGIVVAVLYATVALKMRPRKGCVLRLVVITNAYMLLVAGANLALGANYMFLCRPPVGDSPFFFLPWPGYLAFLEVLGVALCILLYLPFVLRDRRQTTDAKGQS